MFCSVERGVGLGLCALLVLAAGCGPEEGLTVTVVAGDDIDRPTDLSVLWLSDRGSLYEREHIPVTSEDPLASIFVHLDHRDTSDRRILVRGTRSGGAASVGAIRIPYAAATTQPMSITMRAWLADGDGDGIPDVIDDCAAGACAPRADGGPAALPVSPEPGPFDAGAAVDAELAPDAELAADVGLAPDAQAAADVQAAADTQVAMDAEKPTDTTVVIEDRAHSRPPAAGLVALWEMDDGTGSTVKDSSGHNSPGTIMRPTGNDWVTGQQGTALALSGTNWMSAPPSPRYDAVSGLTLSAWVFWAQPTSATQTLMARQRGTGWQNAFWLGMDSNRLHFSIEDLGISATLPSGRWVHVAGTYDGARVILYVGGVEQARQTIAPKVTAGARGVSVGADISTADSALGTSMFVGRLDDVAIHARALTAEEIATLAK